MSVPALPRPEFYPSQIRKLLVKNYYYWLWSVGPGNVFVQVVLLAPVFDVTVLVGSQSFAQTDNPIAPSALFATN